MKIKGQDVTFRYDTGEKTRRVYDDGRREFFFTKNATPSLYHPEVIKGGTVAFLCEGETDTMRLWQELQDNDKTDVAVFGIGGVNTWLPAFSKQLNLYDRVFVVLDNDADYQAVTQVNTVWKSIRTELGIERAKRIRLPDTVKDLCDFFSLYDLKTLTQLAKRYNGESRFKPLDLTLPPTPPNWLVNGLFARGDVTLLGGREGLGKSMLTQALAVAVVEGHKKFLGETLSESGRVLYVDQENPQDDIYRRLIQLGAGERCKAGDLRYLSDQAIRLDRNPDDLLEEAIEFDPVAIILDSLTRIHTQDENNAGQMAALFNDGIQPLARKTGAAVILIHHDNKTDNPRGSVDITASPDNVLHVRGLGDNNNCKFMVVQGKTRRRRKGSEIVVEITDQPNNRITLESNAVITPPF